MGIILPKISKLLIEPNNESVVGDVFIAKVEQEAEERLGTILGLIELFGQPDEFVDGFFEILADLKTEYYLPPLEAEHGVEKRFEECLGRANKRINKLVEESILKVELKNLNVLIGLSYRHKIYLSQIGKNNAFLFHQKQGHQCVIVDIFSQTASKKTRTNQEKMFSNIISGEIGNKDNILFCNDAILEYLSQSQLSEIICDKSISSSVQEIERQLGKKSKDNFYAVVIQTFEKQQEKMPRVAYNQKAETERNATTAERPETIKEKPQGSLDKLLNLQENTKKHLTPSLTPNWKKILMLILIGIKKLAIYTFIGLKWSIEKINASIKNAGNKSGTRAATIQAPDEATTKILDELPEEPKEPNHRLQRGPLPASSGSDGIFGKMSDWLNRQIAKFVRLNRLQKILLIVAFVLVFLFSQSIVHLGQTGGKQQKADVQSIIQETEEAINTAEAKNIFNDEDGAKESLSEARELLTQIPDNRKYQDFKLKTQEKIDGLNQLLQKITYLENPTIVADINNRNAEANTRGLAKSGNILFTFDNQAHMIYKVDLEKKQTLSVPLSAEIGQVAKIAILNDTTLVMLNDRNEIYRYNLEDNSAEKSLVVGGAVADIGIYANKIYSLQPTENQIYKHTETDAGFNSGSTWIKDSTDMSEATALTIDGGIYVAYQNGEIKYFTKGTAASAGLSETTPPLTSPTQLFSDIDSNFLYVLDPKNQRVIIFEKNGNLRIQFTSKDFANIKSMSVQEAEKKIYLLSDNKIFALDI